jgi:hypothetical protein
MQHQLMEMANMGQIDQETTRRLETSVNSEFKPSPIRYFSARKATIVTDSSELLSIRIMGFGESFKGGELICSNVDNPENLEVSLVGSEMVLQSSKDPDILYVKCGEASITGKKYSHVARDLDAPAESLKALPRRDPDIVQIDKRIYRQTGTVHISGPFFVIILER